MIIFITKHALFLIDKNLNYKSLYRFSFVFKIFEVISHARLDTCVKKANVSCTHKTLISHRSSDKRLRLKWHIWIFVTMCNGPAVNPLGPNLVHIVRDCGARACAPPCPFACAHVARMYACIGVCIVHRPTGCSAPKLYFQNVWFEKEIALTRSACKVLVFGKLRRIFNNFSVFFANVLLWDYYFFLLRYADAYMIRENI